MGMYTKFRIIVKLKDFPFKLGESGCFDVDEIDYKSSHKFFTKDRAGYIRWDFWDYETYVFETNVKNYHDVIEEFFDWISEYISMYDGVLVGAFKYEVQDFSYPIFWKDNKLKIVERV